MTAPIEDNEIQKLLGRVRAAESEQVRVAAQLEQAEADHQAKLAKLQEEFGVSTPTEVKELLTSLDEQLRAEVTRVEEGLAQAESKEAQ